jgi:hypothetical protein
MKHNGKGYSEGGNPKLWAKLKAKAKAKFDVYPNAYANGSLQKDTNPKVVWKVSIECYPKRPMGG